MGIIKIVIYSTSTGKAPFSDWEDQLDTKNQAIIANRLDRISLGNFGDSKPIKGGQGVREVRIDYGPGYRIYFGMHGLTVVVLLIGGDKGSQSRDVEKAKRYWTEYKEKLS